MGTMQAQREHAPSATAARNGESRRLRRLVPWAIVLAFVLFAGWHSARHDALFYAPVEADPSKEVVLFATSWCGYCAKARDFFERNEIAYTEYDIERSEEGRRRYEALGGVGVPVFTVDGAPIYGFDLRALVDALTAEPERAPSAGRTLRSPPPPA
jgi:mycoredoxin